MKRKISIARLQSWARKGSQVAFKSKSNAKRYQGMLNRRGYSTGTLRSYGPTMDGGYAKSYYVIGKKRRRR